MPSYRIGLLWRHIRTMRNIAREILSINFESNTHIKDLPDTLSQQQLNQYIEQELRMIPSDIPRNFYQSFLTVSECQQFSYLQHHNRNGFTLFPLLVSSFFSSFPQKEQQIILAKV